MRSGFLRRNHEYTICYYDVVVYKNTSLIVGIAFLLFRDGIRELRFTKGLEEWELADFLQVLISADSLNLYEDDCATLLWEKDLLHIEFVVIDEFLDESSAIIPRSIEQLREKISAGDVVGVADDSHENLDDDGIDNESAIYETMAGQQSIFMITPEDSQHLQCEIQQESAQTVLFHIIDIIFDIFIQENNSNAYQDAANYLLRCFDAQLMISSFAEAGTLLRQLRTLLAQQPLLDWQQQILQKVILRLGEKERIDRLAGALQQEDDEKLAAMHDFIIQMDASAIPALLELSGEHASSRVCNMLADALAELGRHSVPLFTQYLKDPCWYRVRTIVMILQRIGGRQCLYLVQKVINHPDARVRGEVMNALGAIRGEDAENLLAFALHDSDRLVRGLAAYQLGKLGTTSSIRTLISFARSQALYKLNGDSLHLLFSGLAASKSSLVVPVLRSFLSKRSWLFRKYDGIYREAAQALAELGTPDALAVLQDTPSFPDRSAKRACLNVGCPGANRNSAGTEGPER